MSPKYERQFLEDGSYYEISIFFIQPDLWRPHGVRYRLAWVQNDICRVLFDNHHGKRDHYHVDDHEYEYQFINIDRLYLDFESEIRKRGGMT